MTESTSLLYGKNISKSFSGVQVLRDIDFSVAPGEIHALAGENGAGKSPLIKILTGVYSKDSGEIYFRGDQMEINNLGDAYALGIGIVFQELSLVPTLTVAENIFLGREPVNAIGMIDKARRLKIVKSLIEIYDFPLDPNAIVETLSIGHRQLVEILKALSLDVALLIMDEPTASLTTKETEHLFRIIRELTRRGVSILYISHRMEEVYSLMDRITILRDGRKIGTFSSESVTPEEIIRHMIGKSLVSQEHAVPRDNAGKTPVLSVKNLCVPGLLDDLMFDVYPGEVVCLFGLIGSGRTETLRALFGMDKTSTGEIRVRGERIVIHSPQAALHLGIGFVPEDRRLEGFVPMLSVRSNIVSANFDWINKLGIFTDSRRELRIAEEEIDSLSIRPRDPNAAVINLSGGNQQKTVLGKMFARNLNLLLIDEPTAGVDVGAKSEIYDLVEKLLRQNVGVLLASSDLEEVLRLSNRILVLYKGGIIREVAGGSVSKEQLLTIASGLELGNS